MSELPFDATATLWRLVAYQPGAMRNFRLEGEWTLREVISYVVGQHIDEQWRFAAVSNAVAIDHFDMRRIASTSIFQTAMRNEAVKPVRAACLTMCGRADGGLATLSPSRSTRVATKRAWWS